MKLRQLLTNAAVGLSCLAVLLSSTVALAGSPAANVAMPSVTDVRLDTQGVFRGGVVDAQGTALAGVQVDLYQSNQRIGETKTDAQGQFALAGLRTGVHVVTAAGQVRPVRVWTERIAPPAAANGLLVVADAQTARGQSGLYQWVSEHYILTACGVAAAIAVPCALIDTEKKSSSP